MERKRVKKSGFEGSAKKPKLADDVVVAERKNNSDQSQIRKIKRPWRNKVRKNAAKLAARERREKEALMRKQPAEEFLRDASEGKRQKKKKKKKKANHLLGQEGTSNGITEQVQKLKSARFRFINEQLYKMSGKEAVELFKEDPEAFQVYHDGFRTQAKKWPFNPVNEIIHWLKSLEEENLVVADMGCGDAEIAKALEGLATVHSFDLVAANDRVTACDMAEVPLEKKSVNVVVFCLSLMGTNLYDYLREANRILKKGGSLKIAEVASRFSSVTRFIFAVNKMGFELVEKKNAGNAYFVLLEFVKTSKAEKKHPTGLKLEPCYYKKR